VGTKYRDPIANHGTFDWDYYDFTNINDGDRQPTVPTSSPATTETVYHSDANPSESSTWRFSIPHSWRRVTEVTLWVYRNYNGDEDATFTINFSGPLGAADSAQWVGNWYGQTWTGLTISLWDGHDPVVTGTFDAIAKGDDTSAYAAMYIEYEEETYTPGATQQLTAVNHSHQTGSTVTLNPGDTRDLDDEGEFVAFQFDGLEVEQGETVANAWFDIWLGSDVSGEAVIKCDDADSPSALSASANDISSRSLTTANYILANVDNGSLEADIASLIQEVIDRPGWTADNRIVVVIEGQEHHSDSFEIDLSVDATLDIGYTVPPGGGGGTTPVMAHSYRRRRTP